MKKFITDLSEKREFCHLVGTEDGKKYYVDSALTLMETSHVPQGSYETMAFIYNGTDTKNYPLTCDIDWGNPVYQRTYKSKKEMAEGHKYVINNIEEAIESEENNVHRDNRP